MLSGLERVMTAGDGLVVQFRRLDQAGAWKWAARTHAELWQVVALHHNLDPDLLCHNWFEFLDGPTMEAAEAAYFLSLGRAELKLVEQKVFYDLISAAFAISFGNLQYKKRCRKRMFRSVVSLADFLRWALGNRLESLDVFSPRAVEPYDRITRGATNPWGSHSTVKLEAVIIAANLWRPQSEGGTYNPADISTAPLSEDVVNKLVRLPGISQNTAESIASIVRGAVRTGPRPTCNSGAPADDSSRKLQPALNDNCFRVYRGQFSNLWLAPPPVVNQISFSDKAK